jgi:hypothetical protein
MRERYDGNVPLGTAGRRSFTPQGSFPPIKRVMESETATAPGAELLGRGGCIEGVCCRIRPYTDYLTSIDIERRFPP